MRDLEVNIQQLLTDLDEEKTSHQDALSVSLHLETFSQCSLTLGLGGIAEGSRFYIGLLCVFHI